MGIEIKMEKVYEIQRIKQVIQEVEGGEKNKLILNTNSINSFPKF